MNLFPHISQLEKCTRVAASSLCFLFCIHTDCVLSLPIWTDTLQASSVMKTNWCRPVQSHQHTYASASTQTSLNRHFTSFLETSSIIMATCCPVFYSRNQYKLCFFFLRSSLISSETWTPKSGKAFCNRLLLSSSVFFNQRIRALLIRP